MNLGYPTRITAIDLTKGFAVGLMILSHGVKGLLSFDQFPDWGLVPIHLITKFSSTTFFIAFGLSLAVSFAPATQDPDLWPAKRKKLILRGLVVLFWFKVLTVIELAHLHNPQEIMDALFYRQSTSYAEILGFYALALLWIPFVLPLWQKCSRWIKALLPLALATIAILLSQNFDFWQSPQLKALLVEEEGFYTWGQLSRSPFVFLGMFIGSFLKTSDFQNRGRLVLSGVLGGMALLLSVAFLVLYDQQLYSTLEALAMNEGKHPPNVSFILFSLSGALGILAFAFLIGEKGAKWLSPFTLIGKNTLSAFIFHLTVLFIFYRLLFDLWLKVSYVEALGLSVLLLVMTAIWLMLKKWETNHETFKTSHRNRDTRTHDFNTRKFQAN